MVQRFRKKPVEVEALRYTGANKATVLSWVYPGLSGDALEAAAVMGLPVVIETLEGDMTVNVGDWVIKGVAGEFYPCKHDIFMKTYVAV